MKLKPIAPNQTEISIGDDAIFFSYAEPVAACIAGRYYRTKKKWSTTTSKHINDWLDGTAAEVRSQEWFDQLIPAMRVNAQDEEVV